MIALAFAFLAHSGIQTASKSLEIVRVEARLFYEGTGRLSEDILNRSEPFLGWNTAIGEGSAEEAANYLLVAVRLVAPGGEETYDDGPILLSVRDSQGKVLATRTFRNALTSKDGVVVLPLWVNDVACAGELNIVATYGGKSKTGQLTLDCGE